MRPLLVLAVLLLSASAPGQEETIVNARLPLAQRDAQIEHDSPGTVLVVWTSEDHAGPGSRGDIVFRRLTTIGLPLDVAESMVHDGAGEGDQEKPALAANGAGSAVVVWSSLTDRDSAYDIKARRVSLGTPIGSEFLVNTTVARSQTEPDVAMRASGEFVVVWNGWTEAHDRDVYLRVYAADGTPLTGEVRMNTTLAYSQARPAVRYRPDGNIVAVWESWLQDGGSPAGYGVVARIFDSLGVPVTGEIPVNSYTPDYQWYADCETFADNSFAVVWCSWEQDGSDGTIMMQRFGADGSKVGGETQVNTTTAFYQWLPRIRRNADGAFVVVWSSWNQDGSREGVYLQAFDAGGRKVSFETRANITTAGFQWEPDAVMLPGGDVRVVWSGWTDVPSDYDVVLWGDVPVRPQGVIRSSTIAHTAGRTTTRVRAHVVDSLALTGHAYEVLFDSLPGRTAAFSVRDLATGDTVVQDSPVDRGENVFYLSPVFDGLAIEVEPEFDLDLDLAHSYTVNSTGTGMTFQFNPPSAGAKRVAPIDVALIWGATDTLADGSYAAVLDTALSTTGKREVLVPFRAWNLTDNARVDLLVVDNGPANKRWSPGERIVFLTPPAYRLTATNTHAEVRPLPPAGAYALPGIGDTNVVLTVRPISGADRFTFTATQAAVLGVAGAASSPGAFALFQNYPNPFNPSTTIRYTVPAAGDVSVRVYDLLGREVRTLAAGFHQAGSYRVRFDASGLSSGVYFYRLEAQRGGEVRKMILVR